MIALSQSGPGPLGVPTLGRPTNPLELLRIVERLLPRDRDQQVPCR